MKLPDIRTNRAVPTLASPKAAELPSKLRKLAGGVQMVDGAVKVIDTAMEEEARLDAGRRVNQLKREYFTQQQQMLEDFHSSNRDPDDLLPEMGAMRDNLRASAVEGAGGRAGKYINKALDDFHTRVSPIEGAAALKLVQSRTLLTLRESSQDLVEDVAVTPTDMGAMTAEYFRTLDSVSTLSNTQRRGIKDQVGKDVVNQAMLSLLEKGDLDGISQVQESEYYGLLTPKEQDSYSNAVTTAALTEVADELNTFSNQVMQNPDLLESALEQVDKTLTYVADPGTPDYDAARDAAHRDLYVSKAVTLMEQEDYDALEAFVREAAPTRLMTQQQMAKFTGARKVGADKAVRRAYGQVKQGHAEAVHDVRQSGEANTLRAEDMRAKRAAADAEGNISVMERYDTMITELEAANDAAPYYKVLQTGTSQELQDAAFDMQAAADDPANPNSLAAKTEYQAWVSKYVALDKRMRNDGAGVVTERDPELMTMLEELRANYDVITDSATLPDDRLAASKAMGETSGTYMSAVTQAQATWGLTVPEQTILPLGGEMAADLAARLNSVQPGPRMDAISLMTATTSYDYNRALAHQLTGGDVAIGSAFLAMSQGNRSLADAYTVGKDVIDTLEAAGDKTSVTLSMIDENVRKFFNSSLVPEEYGPTEGAKMVESLRYLAASGLSRETLAGGKDGNSNIENEIAVALETGYGIPQKVGNNYVLPYTNKKTGEKVAGGDLRLAMRSLEDPDRLKEAIGGADIRDASGTTLNMRTALDYGIIFPVGDGLFSIRMPNSYIDLSNPAGSRLVTSGMVQGPDGKVIEFDMNNVTLVDKPSYRIGTRVGLSRPQ